MGTQITETIRCDCLNQNCHKITNKQKGCPISIASPFLFGYQSEYVRVYANLRGFILLIGGPAVIGYRCVHRQACFILPSFARALRKGEAASNPHMPLPGRRLAEAPG